jgi:hypothetical protein
MGGPGTNRQETLMKLHPAIHMVCAAICLGLGLLFAGQGRLAGVLYVVFLAIEIFVAATTGKQGNDTER